MEEHVGRRFRAVMSLEIGGGNAIQPLHGRGAARPAVVDADAMGRAYPEAQMTSFAVHDLTMYPLTLVDVRGQRGDRGPRRRRGSGWSGCRRRACIEVGSIAVHVQGAADRAARSRTAASSTRRPRRSALGAAVRAARRRATAIPMQAVLEAEGGQLLFTGKVADVAPAHDRGVPARDRGRSTGSTPPRATSSRSPSRTSSRWRWLDGEPRVTTPDLICVLDSVSGEADRHRDAALRPAGHGGRAAGARRCF